jgi:hypothetical protein
LSSSNARRARDTAAFTVGASAFLLASPLRNLWAADNRPWYLPFIVWLAVIAAPVLLQRWRREP